MLQLECQNNINAVDNSHIQHKSARMFCRSYCLTYRAIEFGMRVLLPVQPSPSVPKICWHLLHTPRGMTDGNQALHNDISLHEEPCFTHDFTAGRVALSLL